jgi:hypothetical protein
MSDETKKILKNKEIIDLNQDPLGKSARLVYREKHSEEDPSISHDIWIGQLSGNSNKENVVASMYD